MFNFANSMMTIKRKSLRPKPVASKAGLTKNPKRRYGCGGKIKK